MAGSGECTVVGRGSLQNVFNNCICFGVKMIHGNGFRIMYFLYYYRSGQTNGGIHGKKSSGEGNDRMIKMILLFIKSRGLLYS